MVIAIAILSAVYLICLIGSLFSKPDPDATPYTLETLREAAGLPPDGWTRYVLQLDKNLKPYWGKVTKENFGPATIPPEHSAAVKAGIKTDWSLYPEQALQMDEDLKPVFAPITIKNLSPEDRQKFEDSLRDHIAGPRDILVLDDNDQPVWKRLKDDDNEATGAVK